MDNCLARGNKQILCFLGFDAFPHTNILSRTVKIYCFPYAFSNPAVCFSIRRSQLSKTETFCGNSSVQPTLPMQSTKGAQLTSPMDPTQHVRLYNKCSACRLWHCRGKISHQVLKEILSYTLLALCFQYWSASMLCPSWQVLWSASWWDANQGKHAHFLGLG